MSKLKPYPTYRDSGVDWLGPVPSGWALDPVWTLFRRGKVTDAPDEELLSVYRDHGVVTKASRDDNWNRPSEDLSPYQLVLPGDLVTNKMKAWQGSIAVSEVRGIVSPAYFVYRPLHKHHSRYLHYLLRSVRYIGAYLSNSKGIRPSQWDLDPWKFSRLPVLLPSLDEQRQIAVFLDRETAKIDALIGKQEQLIETLRERREAVVRTVLLSGLDQNVPMKSSGVDALGEIPAHWLVVPTRHLCVITTGTEDSGNATDDGEYPFYVRGREILRIGHFSFDCEAVMTPGDGQGGTGKVFHYAKGRFEAHQRVYVFKTFKNISGWYFYYYLSTFLRHVALAGSNTVTMESLRRPLLADFQVAVPPLVEQKRIADYLDVQTAKIDVLIEKAQRYIELSKERRSALISAAVTGQIDVRGQEAVA